VWQVEIQPGTPATQHRLTREEVFVILSGSALVRIDGQPGTAGPGDVVVVPTAVDFEIVAGGSEPLRALCCLPVGGQAQLADGEPFTPPWAQ
jgi:mannose-6-phosphate isomerase-like protein (cupin superfamily)